MTIIPLMVLDISKYTLAMVIPKGKFEMIIKYSSHKVGKNFHVIPQPTGPLLILVRIKNVR